MRAGCFAEDRVIELVNLRFVPFFFNRGGPGLGKDKAASDFVNGQTTNRAAYLAAFSPDGKMLGETELYADKIQVAAFLLDLLKKHPEYAKPTSAEVELLNATSPQTQLERGRLQEGTGAYGQALDTYRGILQTRDSSTERVPELHSGNAHLGILRMHRLSDQWKLHKETELELRNWAKMAQEKTWLIHADVELGYRLLAEKRYKEARALLQPLTKVAHTTRRLAEAHFYAGVACWFLGDRDWAKLHWMWIVNNLPEDRLFSRARVAAAADGMPYANPELGGFKASVGNIGPHSILDELSKSQDIYEQLLGPFDARIFDAKRKEPIVVSGDAASLVSALRDGNAFVPANNKIVDQLVALGADSLEPLMKSIQNPGSKSRGYSGWALGVVLRSLEVRPQAAMRVLEAATKESDSYIKELSRSGLSQARVPFGKPEKAPSGAANNGQQESSPIHPEAAATTSPFLLVAQLRDGNTHAPKNNEIVKQLEAIGARSLPSLISALQDAQFPGRGYSAWAIAKVLEANDLQDEASMAALKTACEDSDNYVRTLARSGLTRL